MLARGPCRFVKMWHAMFSDGANAFHKDILRHRHKELTLNTWGQIIVAQLVKKFQDLYGTTRIIRRSQEPASVPYIKPDKSNPHIHIIYDIFYLFLGLPCDLYFRISD